MNQGSTIFLVRHATTARVGKALTGWLPGISLDEPGRAQAEALVERMKDVRIDNIFSSPLERTLETAEPLARARAIPIIQDPDLGEVNFGDWQGRYIDDLRDDPEFQLFNTYRSGTRAPGGELMVETQARMVRGILRIGGLNHPGQTSVVFSHADAIKTAIMHALGIPIDFHHRLEIEPASVTILHLFPEIMRVLSMNICGDIGIH